jgi:hypothetical protein
MIKPVWQYVRDEALPRFRSIIFTPETAISVVATVAFVRWGKDLFSSSPKIGDVTTGLIAYAAIALGFCVAGLTISLTLPDRDFASHLAHMQHDGEVTNAYSDLLFVFSWTAIAHWAALAALFATLLFAESNSALFPSNASPLHVWAVSIVAGICVYCLCQFLITLITLSQVGRAYIDHLIRRHSKEDMNSSKS